MLFSSCLEKKKYYHQIDLVEYNPLLPNLAILIAKITTDNSIFNYFIVIFIFSPKFKG
jgi:hypothetical protein